MLTIPASAVDFEFVGVRTYTVFGFLPAPSGGDARLLFAGGGVSSWLPGSIALAFGGGYETDEVFRKGDGAVLDAPYEPSDVTIDRFELYVEPAIEQRLSATIPLELRLGIRSYFRRNLSVDRALFAAGDAFPDRDGALVNSARVGIKFEALDAARGHRDRSGIDAGMMIEWAPPFLGNRIYGGADFLRLNATGIVYVPLFDAAPARPRNLFNVYFAGRLLVDLLTGNTVPFHEQAQVGGFSPDEGLGGVVRGFEPKSKPALFKAVANVELRLIGPAVVLPSILPVLSLFFDVGTYAGFVSDGYGAPSGEAAAIGSTGATVGLSVLDTTVIGFTVAVPVVGVRADRASMGTSLAVGFHF